MSRVNGESGRGRLVLRLQPASPLRRMPATTRLNHLFMRATQDSFLGGPRRHSECPLSSVPSRPRRHNACGLSQSLADVFMHSQHHRLSVALSPFGAGAGGLWRRGPPSFTLVMSPMAGRP